MGHFQEIERTDLRIPVTPASLPRRRRLLRGPATYGPSPIIDCFAVMREMDAMLTDFYRASARFSLSILIRPITSMSSRGVPPRSPRAIDTSAVVACDQQG